MKNSSINIDPEIMSGEPVFNETRVTIKTLFDYLEEGDIGDFLKNSPYITREIVTNVLKEGASRGIPKHKKYATAA